MLDGFACYICGQKGVNHGQCQPLPQIQKLKYYGSFVPYTEHNDRQGTVVTIDGLWSLYPSIWTLISDQGQPGCLSEILSPWWIPKTADFPWSPFAIQLKD